MNHERIAGKWKQLNGALLERWGWLTANRQCVEAGRRDQSTGRAQELYGINKEESQRVLKQFLHRNRRWDVSSR